MKQGGLLVCSGYLARPVFRLRQSVNGGDVAAIKSASSGADSVTFILHSWGEKHSVCRQILFNICHKRNQKITEGMFLKHLGLGSNMTEDTFHFISPLFFKYIFTDYAIKVVPFSSSLYPPAPSYPILYHF